MYGIFLCYVMSVNFYSAAGSRVSGEVSVFLNIGSNFNIFYDDIIAVIDIENMTGDVNNDFIENMRKNKNCVNLSKIRRSLIVVEKKGKTKAYFSSVSVKTIKKRLDTIAKFMLKN